jgi:hypothetical protein
MPTSTGTTIPHVPPEWAHMNIGSQPQPTVGYSTPAHLLPLKESIRADLFRLGTIRDFPLDLIPLRDHYPFFHDQNSTTTALNATMRSKR